MFEHIHTYSSEFHNSMVHYTRIALGRFELEFEFENIFLIHLSIICAKPIIMPTMHMSDIKKGRKTRNTNTNTTNTNTNANTNMEYLIAGNFVMRS